MSQDPPKPHPHGWLILDKPRGLGSTQAVAAVKRVLRKAGYGKVKIGHGGTRLTAATAWVEPRPRGLSSTSHP